MTKVQRVFWLSMAFIFLITSIGFSAIVVWDINRQNKQQQSLQDIKEGLPDNANCAIGSVSGASSEAEPQAFKPEGDVTELQSTDLVAGSGAAVAAGDCLQVKYHGTLATSGEKFDGNFNSINALKFAVGQGQVIPGWDQGLIGMKEGGTRRLVIPSDLAYGSNGSGSIPADSDLVFVVKLIKIGE